MTPTLPAGLVLRLVGDILAQRLAQLRRHIDHNPRGGESKAPRRREQAERMDRDLRRLGAIRATGDVPAAVAGLLLAWAGGHAEAIAQLEEIEPHIEDVQTDNVIRGCEILLGAK